MHFPLKEIMNLQKHLYGGYIALIKVQGQDNMKSEIFLDLYGVRPLTVSPNL